MCAFPASTKCKAAVRTLSEREEGMSLTAIENPPSARLCPQSFAHGVSRHTAASWSQIGSPSASWTPEPTTLLPACWCTSFCIRTYYKLNTSSAGCLEDFIAQVYKNKKCCWMRTGRVCSVWFASVLWVMLSSLP